MVPEENRENSLKRGTMYGPMRTPEFGGQEPVDFSANFYDSLARHERNLDRLDAILEDPEAMGEAVDLLRRERANGGTGTVWPIGNGEFANAVRRVMIDKLAGLNSVADHVPQADNFDRAAVASWRSEAAGVILHERMQADPAFPRLARGIGGVACYLRRIGRSQPVSKPQPSYDLRPIPVFEEFEP